MASSKLEKRPRCERNAEFYWEDVFSDHDVTQITSSFMIRSGKFGNLEEFTYKLAVWVRKLGQTRWYVKLSILKYNLVHKYANFQKSPPKNFSYQMAHVCFLMWRFTGCYVHCFTNTWPTPCLTPLCPMAHHQKHLENVYWGFYHQKRLK